VIPLLYTAAYLSIQTALLIAGCRAAKRNFPAASGTVARTRITIGPGQTEETGKGIIEMARRYRAERQTCAGDEPAGINLAGPGCVVGTLNVNKNRLRRQTSHSTLALTPTAQAHQTRGGSKPSRPLLRWLMVGGSLERI